MGILSRWITRWRDRHYKECHGEHVWHVYSTSVSDTSLELICGRCGLFGAVMDPSEDEWRDSYDAPEARYRWHDNSRVTSSFKSGAEMRAHMRASGVPI